MKGRTFEDITALGCALHRRNYAISCGGNLSYKVGEVIKITASGTHIGYLDDDCFVKFEAINFTQIAGFDVKPSMETAYHLGVYKNFPNITVIAHVHAPLITRVFGSISSYVPEYDYLDLINLEPYNWETEAFMPLIGFIPKQRTVKEPVSPVSYRVSSAPIITSSWQPPASRDERLLVEDLEATYGLLRRDKKIIVYGYHGLVSFGNSALEVFDQIELLNSLVMVRGK